MRRAVLALFALTAFACVAGLGFKRWRQQRENELAVRWDAQAGVFDWGPAFVRLPPGFTHRRLQGIDTLLGHFVSSDGRTVIRYDIGELAGEHGVIGAHVESAPDGSRIRTTRSGAATSFPDNGCANFFLSVETAEGLAAIQAIARSFQPRNRLPAFFVPLLPEPVRRDCRYRLPDFNVF